MVIYLKNIKWHFSPGFLPVLFVFLRILLTQKDFFFYLVRLDFDRFYGGFRLMMFYWRLDNDVNFRIRFTVWLLKIELIFNQIFDVNSHNFFTFFKTLWFMNQKNSNHFCAPITRAGIEEWTLVSSKISKISLCYNYHNQPIIIIHPYSGEIL